MEQEKLIEMDQLTSKMFENNIDTFKEKYNAYHSK